jgi:general secretion pathway protein L
VSSLAQALDGSSSSPGAPRVIVALPPRQILRKQLVLPAAVEENLLRTLAYDLDRHTPFRPDQVYFDATVINRDLARKTIRVDWVAALKTIVDSARRQAEDWGASVVAVLPGPASATPPRVNLSARRRPTSAHAMAAVAGVGAHCAGRFDRSRRGTVPLIQKRGYAIALIQQTEAARVQAEAAAGVRREFERLQATTTTR